MSKVFNKVLVLAYLVAAIVLALDIFYWRA